MQIIASFGSPLSDLVGLPFKAYSSIPVDPLTMKLIGSLPVLAFIALLIAAVWRQSKKFPTKVINDSNLDNFRSF